VDTYYVSIYQDTHHRRGLTAGLCGGERTLTLEDPFQRKQAYLALNGRSLPHGLPTDESISAVEAAELEFRAAQAEVDRITQETRAGKR
jgi:hypothetical protein